MPPSARRLGAALLLLSAGCYHDYPQGLAEDPGAPVQSESPATVAEPPSRTITPAGPSAPPVSPAPDDAGGPTQPPPDDTVLGEPGECWDPLPYAPVRTAEDCEQTTTAAIADYGLSLDRCMGLCLDDYWGCRMLRSFGYRVRDGACVVPGYCETLPQGFGSYRAGGCVIEEVGCREIRKEVPQDGCDAVHPSWTRVDDVSDAECMELCRADPECARFQSYAYNPGTRVCLTDPSCIPDKLGFEQHSYNVRVGSVCIDEP